MKPSLSVLRSTARIALAALALAASPTWAEPTMVPFEAEVTTVETLGYDADCPDTRTRLFPFNAGTTSGTGHASHLGAVTLTATDCIAPGKRLGTFAFSKGMFTLAAANGDQLTATYKGDLLPTSPLSPVYAIDGVYKITGGTGRFSDAKGTGTLSGTLNILTGQGKFIASGLLTY